MSERNIKLIVEYNGTGFAGWQIQDNQRTIQGELTHAIHRVTGCTVDVVGAGRTDAGVHALGQVANFSINHGLDAARFREALNFYLPREIRVKQSSEVPLAFHARFGARFRHYRYLLAADESALYYDLRWEYLQQLDYDLLRQAAALVAGEHDFRSFCITASLKDDNRCTVDHSRWFRIGPLFVYEIRANRFLHSMVRSLVGAMVNLGSVKQDNNLRNLTLSRFESILHGQVDERVVFTAPACGLYLVNVDY